MESTKACVSAIVHTLNEERNLDACLNALAWVQDIYIVDSGSTDRTCEIARKYTPHVAVREGNRGTLVEQRNWALENLPLATDWVLIVDADEIVEPELRDEVKAILRCPPAEKDGYWCRFKNVFMGRWIKHASMYPTWSLRLFRHKIVRYERRCVNSHPQLQPGRAGYLQGHLWHEDHDGLGAYLLRAVEFARLEAIEYSKVEEESSRRVFSLAAFLESRAARRRQLKLLFIKLPFRPILLFVYLYVVRGGFLDGHPGFAYSCVKSIQEWYVNLYQLESSRAVARASRKDSGSAGMSEAA